MALVAVTLRRVYGLRYWMVVAFCVIALSIAAILWMDKLVWIFALALPTSLAFTIANTNELRTRPWLTIVVVPLLFLAIAFVGLALGVNLGLIRE